MNKTIDINIANQIFHLDENAYKALKNYLDAIKSYLANEEGQEEIIQDIEARIAELFIERMISDKQVINTDDISEVIKIMGQPEDYNLSDEDDNSTKSRRNINKKLFRDKETSYISGVSAGLAHYMGIKVNWVRLLWVIFTIFTTGWFILIYVLLWILIPEARTTAEKLEMKGEPINLSNIEKKIKEGYDNVSDKIKDVDVKKHSRSAQNNISSFFSGLEKFIITLGKILLKLIGIFILIVSGLGLLGILVSALGLGGLGLFGGVEFYNATFGNIDHVMMGGVPTWLFIAAALLAGAIPLLFIFIFSLKILFKNLRSINRPFIITTISIWVICIAFLIIAGINSSMKDYTSGEIVNTITIEQKKQDTLYFKMKGNLNYTVFPFRQNKEDVVYDENNKTLVLYDSSVDIKFKHTSDDNAYIRISKWAYDYDVDQAREKASLIDYKYIVDNNDITLDSYFISPKELKDRSIGVDIDIYLPENTLIKMDENMEDFIENYFYFSELEYPFNEYYNIKNDKFECISCLKKNDTIGNLIE
jgi:phage shock protein PspC (stress-responsive transcriptional regulator)